MVEGPRINFNWAGRTPKDEAMDLWTEQVTRELSGKPVTKHPDEAFFVDEQVVSKQRPQLKEMQPGEAVSLR